jgi:ABC-type Na+ efflux pump permease subunit
MREGRRAQNAVGLREQVILVAVTFLACVIVVLVHGRDKWLAAVFCTIPTFAGMLSYFRHRLGPSQLWTSLSGGFLLHLGLLWLVFGVLLRNRDDVSLLICIPGIFVEAFLLYHGVRFFGAKIRA